MKTRLSGQIIRLEGFLAVSLYRNPLFRGARAIIPCAALFVALLLGACDNQLLSEPSLGVNGSSGLRNTPGAPEVPQHLTASQGKKGMVELSWDASSSAAGYFVYRSESPLLEFVQCGETLNGLTSIQLAEAPGSSPWYRVAAVNAGGDVSLPSNPVRGTSLAQPVISDIVENPADPANSVLVYWYMGNWSAETYKENSQFIIRSFTEAGTLVKETRVNGGDMTDTSVAVWGLAANANYSFEVEAFLLDAQDAVELSSRMDAATARRTRPAAPVDLRTTGGAESLAITLYFELPEKVDVRQGDQYIPTDLFFTISRREGAGAFSVVAPEFRPGSYVPGATVSYTDNILPEKRGTVYEYRVQSYVDNGSGVSSDSSAAQAAGWAMKVPAASLGALVYDTPAEGASEYAGARLPLVFTHDAMGVAYQYVLKEKIDPVGDGHPKDHNAPVTRQEGPFTLAEIDAWEAVIDLSMPSSTANRGRGFYSYEVDVSLDGVFVEKIPVAGGPQLVRENLDIIRVYNFSVLDGYTDKFILTWDRFDNRKYVIREAAAPTGPWTQVAEIASGQGDQAGFTYTISGQSPAANRYFSVQAYTAGGFAGEISTSGPAQTLGIPAVSLTGDLSYDGVKLGWQPVQKADRYRIIYKYADSPDYTVEKSPGELEAEGNMFVFTLKPQGSATGANAGKPITLTLEALNKFRQNADGGGEIKTLSAPITVRVFGPAGLSVSAAKAASASEIALTWNKVEGAAGYYIVRRQYGFDNALPTGLAAYKYYVNAAATLIKGKSLTPEWDDVEAGLPASVVLTGTSYTLTDRAVDDDEYDAKKAGFLSGYINEQNDMAWGYPYRYTVVPVLNEAHEPLLDAVNNAWTVDGVTVNGIGGFGDAGSLPGFAHDVRATKGTHTSGGVNSGILVSWTRPAMINGAAAYEVYRRKQSSTGDWDKLTASPVSALSFEDDLANGSYTPAEGTVYEYLVGVKIDGISASPPPEYARFVAWNRGITETTGDHAGREEVRMAGFILPIPALIAASPQAFDDSDGISETVSWNAAGADDPNRGIAGYEIQVRNRSLGSGWHTIKDVPLDASPAESFAETVSDGTLLQVTRDWRHYFRVRSYTLDGDNNKCYSRTPPDPADFNGGETGYVKWATRKIVSADEFAAAAAIAIASAMQGRTKGDYNVTYSNILPNSLNQNNPPLFTAIAGSLDTCSSNGNSIPVIGGGNKDIFGYGMKVKTGILGGASYTASKNTLTLSGLIPEVNMTVEINSLRSDSGSFQVSYSGSGGFVTTVDVKHYREVFTFSGNTFKDVSGLVWDPALGWQ